MKQYQKIALALAALVVAGTGFAQENAPAGLLGQRYADVSYTVVDVPGTSKNGNDIALAVNLPVTPIFDATLGYDYGWLNVNGVKAKAQTLAATAKLFTVYSGVKPFLALGLNHGWSSAKFGSVKVEDKAAGWNTSIGVEVPFQGFVVTPSIGYADGFERDSSPAYQYAVEASRWFTAKVNGYAALKFDNTVGNGGQVWLYQIGVRVKF